MKQVADLEKLFPVRSRVFLNVEGEAGHASDCYERRGKVFYFQRWTDDELRVGVKFDCGHVAMCNPEELERE